MRIIRITAIGLFVILLGGCTEKVSKSDNPRALIEDVVKAVGGKENFYALRDVEYQFTVLDHSDGKKDVSIERYIFDGQLSWGKWLVREKYAFPQLEGEIVSGYNGKESWATVNGQLMTDPQSHKLVDFTRKTCYYWFAMMYKLLDPGMIYTYKGARSVNGIEYDVVEITFEAGVGDVQDTYVLYINPQTHLVDQFLFTVLDFGITEPLMMKVEYEEVAGLRLPARKKYAPADWEGNIKQDVWVDEIAENIKFNNGFSRDLFEKPADATMSEKN